MPSLPQLAGLSPQTGHHGPGPETAPLHPQAHGWMSDELIAETRRVWSAACERVIDVEEAVEILMNVRRLTEVLMRAESERDQP